MVRSFAVSAFVLLTIAGCATGAGNGMGDPGDDKKACHPDHRPPSEVAVVVYLDAAGDVQVVPEKIVMEHPNQRVIWTAADGEISNIEFAASDCAPGPPTINRRGRQLSTSIPGGGQYRGTHKYSFTFHPASGESQYVDPLIVIEY